jgi:hypothetical protein
MTGWALAALVLISAVRHGSAGAFLAALGIAAVNVLSLYLWPFGPCLSCNGTGRNTGSNRRRYGECRRCKGAGRRQRTGARLVHRGAVSLAEKARKRGSRS